MVDNIVRMNVTTRQAGLLWVGSWSDGNPGREIETVRWTKEEVREAMEKSPRLGAPDTYQWTWTEVESTPGAYDVCLPRLESHLPNGEWAYIEPFILPPSGMSPLCFLVNHDQCRYCRCACHHEGVELMREITGDS